VRGAAALLTVSADTAYDLFQKGELPGRKVGRKWVTTKAALLRWIENRPTFDLEKVGAGVLSLASIARREIASHRCCPVSFVFGRNCVNGVDVLMD
jgi:excisionase family DNA binding protein